MRLASIDGGQWTVPFVTNVPQFPDRNRRQRILQALGMPGGDGLKVDEHTLARYYDYLVENLQIPFSACYPAASTPAQTAIDRCTVIELLDPRKTICDEFDGLFCRTRKNRFIVNLPLVELSILRPSHNVQAIEDYTYWFWHYRG